MHLLSLGKNVTKREGFGMFQRNKLVLYIVIIGLSVILFGNSTIVANSKLDIMKMAELLEKEQGLELGEWSVYAREEVTGLQTKEDLDHEVSKLQKSFPEFTWEKETQAESYKAAATFKDVEKGIIESINLMSTHINSELVTYMVYEVKGQQWNNASSAHLERSFQNRIKDIFRGNPTIFSCIEGIINDTIDEVLSFQTTRFLDLFQAEEIESLREPTFVSISGKTEMFRQTLTTDGQMNLQLALRKDGLGSQTTFTVGTPIITFEY
jgi:TATA-box binding